MWKRRGKPDWWGLEYLFGVHRGARARRRVSVTPFWAHDRAQEKQALRTFIELVRAAPREAIRPAHLPLRGVDEKSALLRLAAKHATCEAAVDELISAGVLVDLYAVVPRRDPGLRAVLQHQRSSSRSTWVTTCVRASVTDAAASIVEYHAYCQARDSGDAEGAAKLLAEIPP